MLKQILFGALMSSSAIALAPTLMKEQNNEYSINTVLDEEHSPNNQMVYDTMKSLLTPKVTNGESLRQGKNVSVALPLLWNTVDSVKSAAKKKVETIPTVGPILVGIVEEIKDGDLKFVDPDAILHVGENIFDLTLTIGGEEFNLTMKMTGVAS